MARTDNPERLPRERRLRAPAGTRLRAARFPLAITFVLLHLGWLVWDVPLAVTLAAFAVIAAVTAFAPRKAVVRRTRREERREVARWPDTSMKTIVNTVRNPAFLLDISGVVRFANAAAVRQFPETRPGDLLTLTFRSPQLIDAVREAAAGASSQVQYRERGDDTRLYSVEIDPVKQPGLTSEFLLVMFDDVSEQLALARMRSDFVANASHELRTPLASLTGFVETLLGPAREDREASDKFLHIMLEQAERMRRLIDDLLSLSRLEMRAHHPPGELIDLPALLRHVCEALAPVALEGQVVVKLDLTDEPLMVPGDTDELTQVFQNLIENGLKYGQSGGKLDISLQTRITAGLPVVAVTVRDYGPGIPAEHLPRLTERFYRVDVTTSRLKNGTGLGLAIVKHILAHHRGRLLVDSKPGEGAVFTIELPTALSTRGEEENKGKSKT